MKLPCAIQIGTEKWDFEIETVKEIDGITYRLSSTAFVCPVCLQVWAAMMIGAPSAYYISGHTCGECDFENIYNRVPGSIVSEGGMLGRLNKGLLVQLPRLLLQREFNLHFRFCIERTPVFDLEYEKSGLTLGDFKWQANLPITTSPPSTKPQENRPESVQDGITQTALLVFA